MKTESNTRPELFEVNKLPDGMAEVVLCENVAETPDGCEYDMYILNVPYRDTLMEDIGAALPRWVEWARAKEAAAAPAVTSEQRIAAIESALLEMAGELYG